MSTVAVPGMPPLLLPTALPPFDPRMHRAPPSFHGRSDRAQVSTVRRSGPVEGAGLERGGRKAYHERDVCGLGRWRRAEEGGARAAKGTGRGVLAEEVRENDRRTDEMSGQPSAPLGSVVQADDEVDLRAYLLSKSPTPDLARVQRLPVVLPRVDTPASSTTIPTSGEGRHVPPSPAVDATSVIQVRRHHHP